MNHKPHRHKNSIWWLYGTKPNAMTAIAKPCERMNSLSLYISLCSKHRIKNRTFNGYKLLQMCLFVCLLALLWFGFVWFVSYSMETKAPHPTIKSALILWYHTFIWLYFSVISLYLHNFYNTQRTLVDEHQRSAQHCSNFIYIHLYGMLSIFMFINKGKTQTFELIVYRFIE